MRRHRESVVLDYTSALKKLFLIKFLFVLVYFQWFTKFILLFR